VCIFNFYNEKEQFKKAKTNAILNNFIRITTFYQAKKIEKLTSSLAKKNGEDIKKTDKTFNLSRIYHTKYF